MRTRIVVIVIAVALLLLPILITPVAASSSGSGCGPNVTHLVQRGENLFRISLRYGTTMNAIAEANGIWNYALIYAGQVLRIPCPAGYIPPYAPTPTPLPPVYTYRPPFYIPPIYVDCSRLAGTSPLGGLAYGDNTFYWEPIPGATSYRVNVYSVDANPGALVGTWDTPATRSSLVGFLGGSAGPGFQFSWEVVALVSDIPVCRTGRYTMFREAP